MVNLLDITAKSKKAGRAGVRQESKAYGCPDIAEHEEDDDKEHADEEGDDEEQGDEDDNDEEDNFHPLIEDEDEEDDLPDPESYRVDHSLDTVDQVQFNLVSLYFLDPCLFFPDATGQVGGHSGHRCHSPLPDQVLP